MEAFKAMPGNKTRIIALSTLLVCCAVMYVTLEQDDAGLGIETVLTDAGEAQKSIMSTDVEKVGIIYTKTPDGRMRLLNYFTKVESMIAKEMAARKSDVAAVRAQMARNMAYNIAARKKMKAMLLKRMARNAKAAKDHLHAAMRRTAAKFAAAAELGNKRNRANIARSKKTREIMVKNKREASSKLAHAVAGMQRALAATASAVNARISQTNKHIAANAAQIKENARIARANLQKAMNHFNHKIANASEQAKKGRSKLAAQAVAMNKKTRAMIANKVNAVAASTAAQFNKVRAQMAKDRHHADMMLKQATSRMQASLNANRALMDKRFAKTVADIAAAKKEAAARVNAAKAEFKIGLLHLSSTVKSQAQKLNNRVNQLSATVVNNKLEQDKINRQRHAEIKRMIKLGNQRYEEHLKHDKELRKLMAKNKAATQRKMDAMAKSFQAQISKIHHQMKKDRAHATHMLARRTAALYQTLAKNSAKQRANAKKQAAQTRRAKLDLMERMRQTQNQFRAKLAKLHATVVKNEQKQNGRVQKLTGVVAKNAMRDARGRKLLRYQMKANALELKSAIRSAVAKGEQRALKFEKNMKAMNKKAIASMNQRIAVKISRLAKQTSRSINKLQQDNRADRAALKKELTFAVKSAAAEAKKNLAKSVKAAQGRFLSVQAAMKSQAKKSAAERARLLASMKANQKLAQRAIKDAVAEQTRALIALKTETSKSIKSTNTRLNAYAKRMMSNAKAAAAKMKASVSALNSKIAAAREEAKKGLKTAARQSAMRQAAALKSIKSALDKAAKQEAMKVKNLYMNLSKKRSHNDVALGGGVQMLNKAIAKMMALSDARFRKTVKNLAKARAAAKAAVDHARKFFATAMVTVTSAAKNQEMRLAGDVAVVSSMTISNRQIVSRVQRRVTKEIFRVVRMFNHKKSQSYRARGKLRELLNRNKKGAAQQVFAMAGSVNRKIQKMRSQAAKWRRSSVIDLTASVKTLYVKMSMQQNAQQAMRQRITAATRAALSTATSDAKLKMGHFASKLTIVANMVTANNKHMERRLYQITGVSQHFSKSHKGDVNLMKQQRTSLNQDLNKAIVRAIQLGEARGKAVVERISKTSLSPLKKALQAEIADRVNTNADRKYKTAASMRAAVADNYLSVKAYTAAKKYDLEEYVANAKGRGLSSIGDFLLSVGRTSKLRTRVEQGIGAGAWKIKSLFSGKDIKVKSTMTKINGLTNEYMRIVNQVNTRWPMGLGRYLMMRLLTSMQQKGILQVDHIPGRSGSYVFVNGHTLGLSNKLKDFATLAVKMKAYEHKLAGLTKKLSKNASKRVPKHPKRRYVKPPEWQGS